MRSVQTLVVRLFNNTKMDSDTFNLIRKLCSEFQLPPDIEFTCYEAYAEYIKRYFCDLEKRFKQTTLEYNGMIKQTSHLIDRTLDEVEKTSLLHTLALISICAKYVSGPRYENLFRSLSKYLQRNGTPYSAREIRITEYIVFKFLGFNVSEQSIQISQKKYFHFSIQFVYCSKQIKTSEVYALAYELARKITKRNHEIIQFNYLHESCISILRLIYLYRKKFDEMYAFMFIIFICGVVFFSNQKWIFCSLHYVEQSSYGYDGNEEIKLAAATVYASTLLVKPESGNVILNEIVHRTYLNESLLHKLGQSIQQFYLDYNRI